jgi:hypothetical protein
MTLFVVFLFEMLMTGANPPAALMFLGLTFFFISLAFGAVGRPPPVRPLSPPLGK